MPQDPILSLRDDSDRLDLGGHQALHRIKSSDTASVFSVLELLIDPGEGADVVALLPRGVPHGYRNTSDSPCRIMDVILPGRGDEFFVRVSALVRSGKASPEALAALMHQFSIN